MGSAFRLIGSVFLNFLQDVGGTFLLLGRVFRSVREFPRTIKPTLYQMEQIGIGSIPLVLVTSVFVGAVAAVQAAYQFQDYVPMRFLGTVVGKSVILELGPVLTALVVGGRVSASIAAELGTMKVTEQIDAMEILAIDPVRYLVLPRMAAAIIMLPVLTIFSDFLAILGGMVVANIALDVNVATFNEGLRLFFYVEDVVSGLLKTVAFGGIIALMGCYNGFRTYGGAEGVGKSTMHAVVSSCLLILITNYFLATVLFRIIFYRGT
ncbi:MAG: MlaE family lipid ABC transporter permease subunit [Candidatus Latescibacteria bacterium]|nr:MlaE family lipid ABC transporter permease subunit [Candidatus Latescibacterota bacterium]NIM22573.1 MlaE family lipid ABC transporter permease subunit [Candidatus Latescibacterota bacterium]NIM64862.1 MlaE family lipid ABC transporter permease subunit [Candidatus Latescibacterota bacterium]NIO01377.1 MlaE family lipid ABC transporter permease subunit [Candidatus Latescibacterota bacterium]NIO27887.1 MlaE family lipid ABC transporter permease subunit [Candidatus Latescibacterota bacterium]